MKRVYVPFAGLLAAMMGSAVLAQQAPAPADQPTDPSSASSPHQRSTVKSPATPEAPTSDNGNGNNADPSASSSPHQKQVTKKKHKRKAAPPPSSQN